MAGTRYSRDTPQGASADDDRFGIGSVLAEALEHRRQCSARLAGREYVVGLADHAAQHLTEVYT